MKNLSDSRKIVLAFGTVATLTSLFGIVIVLSLNAIGRSGEFVGARLAPLVDVAVEIKLHGAQAHLIMEELMASDTAEESAEDERLLAESRFFANAILNGAENEHGPHMQRSAQTFGAGKACIRLTLFAFMVPPERLELPTH